MEVIMKKAIVIYGSTTGNTEIASEAVEKGLKNSGIEVVKKDVKDSSVDEVKEYDFVILGSSTWGEGELQDDFEEFYDAMDDSFNGASVAVFGCGDSDMFPHCFCKAVDQIEEKAKECGAKIVGESYKIDGEVDGILDEIEQWAKKLVQ
jgi:flavodoxin I